MDLNLWISSPWWWFLFLPQHFGEMVQLDYFSNGSNSRTRTRSLLHTKDGGVWEDQYVTTGLREFPSSTPSLTATVFGNSDRFPVFQALKADMLSEIRYQTDRKQDVIEWFLFMFLIFLGGGWLDSSIVPNGKYGDMFLELAK